MHVFRTYTTRLKGLRVLICNVYRPPNMQAAWMDSLALMLERAVLDNVAIVGDGGL